MDIPATFWRVISDKEWDRVARTGELDAPLCKRLWAMMGRTDPPPDRMTVLVNEEDLMRLIEK